MVVANSFRQHQGKEQQSAHVVVGRFSTRRFSLRTVIGVGCAAVVVVAAAGCAFLAFHHSSTTGKQQTDSQTFTSLESQAATDAANGKVGRAAAAWTGYAAATTSPAHKKIALENAGGMYMSEGTQTGYAKAIQAYKAAVAIEGRLDYSNAVALAGAYTNLGQKSQAIYYLKQALHLMPRNDFYSSEQASLKQEINSLGGSAQ